MNLKKAILVFRILNLFTAVILFTTFVEACFSTHPIGYHVYTKSYDPVSRRMYNREFTQGTNTIDSTINKNIVDSNVSDKILVMKVMLDSVSTSNEDYITNAVGKLRSNNNVEEAYISETSYENQKKYII